MPATFHWTNRTNRPFRKVQKSDIFFYLKCIANVSHGQAHSVLSPSLQCVLPQGTFVWSLNGFRAAVLKQTSVQRFARRMWQLQPSEIRTGLHFMWDLIKNLQRLFKKKIKINITDVILHSHEMLACNLILINLHAKSMENEFPILCFINWLAACYCI